MGLIVREHTYIDGLPAKPSEVNDNEDVLYNEINGGLDWDNIDATLINEANGFIKLDASGDIPVAQMPTVIDADTVDTKHYTDITDKITADIATHTALANVHHAPTTTLTHAALTGVGADDHHAKTINLADMTEKAHGSLTGVGTSDHHTKTSTLLEVQPDYDSGWVSITNGVTQEFTHNLNSWSFITVVKARTGSGYSHTLIGLSNVAVDVWLDTQNTIQVANTWATKEFRVTLWEF